MTITAVLDVNILASAIATPGGLPARVVDLGLEWEVFDIVVSEAVITKLGEVLERPYFVRHASEDARRNFLALVDGRAGHAEVKGVISGVADDAEDDAIIETAVAGKADVIVTGDKGLLALHPFRGIAILTASEFLAMIEASKNG